MTSSYLAALGGHIKRLRDARDLTRDQLAERAEVTTEALARWERGKSRPTLKSCEQLANAFGLSLPEFLQTAPLADDELNVQRITALARRLDGPARRDVARLLENVFQVEKHQGPQQKG